MSVVLVGGGHVPVRGVDVPSVVQHELVLVVRVDEGLSNVGSGEGEAHVWRRTLSLQLQGQANLAPGDLAEGGAIELRARKVKKKLKSALGYDHDKNPLKFNAKYINKTLDIGFYSRRREINKNSSFSVRG